MTSLDSVKNTASYQRATYAMSVLIWIQKLLFGSSENIFASGALEIIKLERMKSMRFGAQQTPKSGTKKLF